MRTDKERYYREIAIAQEALRKSNLLCLSKNENMVCDIYCAVSVEHQTFYAQVYEDGADFIVMYAKTYVKGIDGEIKALPFTECEKLLSCFNADSRVICKVKRISGSNKVICKLMECLPVEDKWFEDEGIVIDGVKTVVRSFYKGELCGVLRFRSSGQLNKAGYNAEQIRLLNNLYIVIEDVI